MTRKNKPMWEKEHLFKHYCSEDLDRFAEKMLDNKASSYVQIRKEIVDDILHLCKEIMMENLK